jgi:hypothetical protein
VPDQIRETAGTILEATAGASPNTYPVLLISEGKGSSGVYPRETLQEAARNKIIPAGTFSFIDHPTESDRFERPERSVKDLAAVTTTDATWSDEHNGLVAEMRVFGPYQPLIAEVAKHIGLSILGDGDIEMREGQKTVTHLAHVQSVDWVTRAGRGGKVLERLLESARQPLAEARNVGQHFESRMHQDFTNRADEMAAQGHLTREERIHLSGAVGQGLTAFAGHLEEHAPQLYQRDIYDEPGSQPDVTESATTTVPAGPGAVTTSEKKGASVPELSEADIAQLRESAARAEAAEARLAESNARLAALQTRDAARPLIAAHLAEAEQPLPTLAQVRVVEAVLAAGVPTGEQGAIDTAALNTAVEAAAAREAAYLAALAPAAPVRESYGAFGSQQGARSTEIAEAGAVKDYDTASARTFGRKIQGA